jgi:hypothetical protein
MLRDALKLCGYLIGRGSSRKSVYSDPSGYESGQVSVSCATNLCKGAGVELPSNTDFYLRGNFNALIFGGSLTVTASGKSGTPSPATDEQVNAGKDSIPAVSGLRKLTHPGL